MLVVNVLAVVIVVSSGDHALVFNYTKIQRNLIVNNSVQYEERRKSAVPVCNGRCAWQGRIASIICPCPADSDKSALILTYQSDGYWRCGTRPSRSN